VEVLKARLETLQQRMNTLQRQLQAVRRRVGGDEARRKCALEKRKVVSTKMLD